jgi:hypothetical protein
MRTKAVNTARPFPKSVSSLELKVSQFRRSREYFLESILQSDNANFQGNSTVEKAFANYQQTKMALDNSKHINLILESPNNFIDAKSSGLSEKTHSEFLFFKNLSEIFPPKFSQYGFICFYINLRQMCWQVLRKEISIDDKILQIDKLESPKFVPQPGTRSRNTPELKSFHFEVKQNLNSTQNDPLENAELPKHEFNFENAHSRSWEEFKERYDKQPELDVPVANPNTRPTIFESHQSSTSGKNNGDAEKGLQFNLSNSSYHFSEAPEFRQELIVDCINQNDVYASQEPVLFKTMANTEPLAKDESRDTPTDFQIRQYVLINAASQLKKDQIGPTQEIKDLVLKKQKFERKLKSFDSNMQQSKFDLSFKTIPKPIMPIKKETRIFTQIKRNKELEISQLAKKISHLENLNGENRPSLNRVEPEIPKFSNQTKNLPFESFINKYKSLQKASTTHHSPVPNSNYGAREQSGSEFVSKMMSEINRTVSRTPPKYSTPNLKYSLSQF